MAKIYDNILDLVGHTPLVRFHALEKKYSAQANIIGKLEFFNPSFSSKARIAKNMIEEAEKSGEWHPGGSVWRLPPVPAKKNCVWQVFLRPSCHLW